MANSYHLKLSYHSKPLFKELAKIDCPLLDYVQNPKPNNIPQKMDKLTDDLIKRLESSEPIDNNCNNCAYEYSITYFLFTKNLTELIFQKILTNFHLSIDFVNLKQKFKQSISNLEKSLIITKSLKPEINSFSYYFKTNNNQELIKEDLNESFDLIKQYKEIYNTIENHPKHYKKIYDEKKKLAQSIKLQEYEKAAEIRDFINLLKQDN